MWQWIIKSSAGVNAIVLFITFISILWYCSETRKLRKEAVSRNMLSVAPYLMIQWNPRLCVLSEKRSGLLIYNMGNGVAVSVFANRTMVPGNQTKFYIFKGIAIIEPVNSNDNCEELLIDKQIEIKGEKNVAEGAEVNYIEPKYKNEIIFRYQDIEGNEYESKFAGDIRIDSGYRTIGYRRMENKKIINYLKSKLQILKKN